VDVKERPGDFDYDDWVSHSIPVVEARHVRDYTVWLRFQDGLEGEADLSDLVEGESDWIAPLRDIKYFKKFKVNHDTATIEWPNRCDVAPESLHLRVLGLYRPRKKVRR
jgi:hypothetical protein